MSLPFTTQQVLTELLHMEAPSNGYMKCPYCLSSNKPFHWNYKTNQFRCNKNDVHQGNILTFYRDMMGLSNTKEAYDEIIKGLSLSNGGLLPALPVINESPKTEEEEEPIDAEKRDRINRKIIHLLSLSKENEKDLLDRGFLPEEINSYGFVTLPNMDFKDKISFMERLGFKDYDGVPPFYVTKKGNWFINCWRTGILVPYYNIHRQLTVFQLRLNNKDRQRDADGELESKYLAFTSAEKLRGTSAKQVIGYCCEWIQKEGELPIINIKNGVMPFIEGSMKAYLYHCLTGMPTLCAPGVNCLKVLEKELPLLRDLGVYRIPIGYDMDRIMNVNVLTALRKLKLLLESYGFEAPYMEWSTEFVHLNGLHDFIDCNNSFVYMKARVAEMKYREETEEECKDELFNREMKLLKEFGIETIYFAMPDSKTAKEEDSIPLYNYLSSICKTYGFECIPIFWDLKLKGLDDKYAYEQRGIIPN